MANRVVLAVALAAAMGMAALAQAAEAPPEARAVISQQFDAFSRNDAAAAFGLAAPGIKAIFEDPDTFMAMVRGHYAPVYSHKRAEFGEATIDGDTMEINVTLTDDNDIVWSAEYTLTRQPNGQWLISACRLIKSVQQSLSIAPARS